MSEGCLKKAPNFYVRKIIKRLCEKHECDIDRLHEHCYLYKGTQKQIDMMMEEENNGKSSDLL